MPTPGDVVDPSLIHVIERWQSREHFATAHLAEWRAAMAGLGIGDRDLRLFEIGEGEPV